LSPFSLPPPFSLLSLLHRCSRNKNERKERESAGKKTYFEKVFPEYISLFSKIKIYLIYSYFRKLILKKL